MVGWAHKYRKGVTVRFGFDVIRISQIQLLVKNKATGTSHEVVIYCPYWLLHAMANVGILYTHRRGAFGVARFDKQGNARALTRGTSTRLAPRFLCRYVSTKKKIFQ